VDGLLDGLMVVWVDGRTDWWID